MASPVKSATHPMALSNPIGSILNDAMDDVEQAMQNAVNKAHDAVTDILTQTAQNAMLVISSLKGAYIDSLDVAYEKADQGLKENIDRVRDLVKTITTGEPSTLQKMAGKIQDSIIQLSPLNNSWVPLLKDINPQFFAVDSNSKNPVTVTFTGNFAVAEQSGCIPTFTLHDKEFTPVLTTSTTLKFLISVSSDKLKLGVHKYSHLSGTLKMIWNNGRGMAWPWAWQTSTYRIPLRALTTPGRIKVTYTTPATIRKTITSPEVLITRTKKHGQQQIKSTEGWNIVPNSATICWNAGPYGHCKGEITKVDHDVISYKWKYNKGGGKFNIVFEEYRSVVPMIRTEVHDTLKWGSSFIAMPQDGESITEIDFDAFNGEHVTFKPHTDKTNPYIELHEFQGAIQIKAKSADTFNNDSLSLAKVESKVELKSSFVSKNESSDSKENWFK